MEAPFRQALLLGKARIEPGNQLESKERLDARQYHNSATPRASRLSPPQRGDASHGETVADPAALFRPVSPGSFMGQPHTVLIIDDVDLVRRTTNRMFAKDGYRVLEAADADEALGVLSTPGVRVVLVLLDVVLPNKDGVRLYADICVRWPEIPVVFMSAYSAEILVNLGQEDLSVPFLPKPFTCHQLASRVRAALERHTRIGDHRPSAPHAMRG
jgi:CheY-like chemotaxis protein